MVVASLFLGLFSNLSELTSLLSLSVGVSSSGVVSSNGVNAGKQTSCEDCLSLMI